MGHAEPQSHPGVHRYESFLSRIRKGDPKVPIITFNYKHWSSSRNHEERSFRDAHRSNAILKSPIASEMAKGQVDRVLCKVGGYWVKSGPGSYN
jgi:hypothetical protein